MKIEKMILELKENEIHILSLALAYSIREDCLADQENIDFVKYVLSLLPRNV